MLRLEHIEYLYGLIAVPIILILFIWMNMWRRKALKRFGEASLVNSLRSNVSRSKPVLKFVIFILAFLILVIGITNPQIGSKQKEVKREGADLILALDVSNSMKAEDLSPNRLEKAKRSIEKLIDQLEGDRIGIIVFAGEAYVQLPVTIDYAAAKLFLENIDTDIVPTQGTSIASAIDLAMESFGKDLGKNKAVIIITDGENHEEDAIIAAKEAADKGITIHTIGMGSIEGAPIPVYQNNQRIGFKKDNNGNTVVTKLNEQVLQEIAETGNGVYVRASNSEIGLNNILNEVDKLEKKQLSSKIYSDYEDRFQYFLLAALLLLLAEFFIRETKSKWWQRLNLFGEEQK